MATAVPPFRPEIEPTAGVVEYKTHLPRAEKLDLLGLVLAGGRGKRLQPLTNGRAKAAVPFGGSYRLIDFVLSNFVNSGVHSLGVLTQFANAPLLRHLSQRWQLPGSGPGGALVTALPGKVHQGELWYRGTADAIYQNRRFIESASSNDVAAFGADHVYRMDVEQMLRWHKLTQAAATISALPVRVNEAGRFGTIEVDPDWRIVGFHEKVPNPPQIPGNPGWALASMGNYIFSADALLESLKADAADPYSENDFGHNVLPRMIKDRPVYAYDFRTNKPPGACTGQTGYWRDVGTIPAYYEANMESLPGASGVDLLNPQWPMGTGLQGIVNGAEFSARANRNSLLSKGCQVDRSSVAESVLGRNVNVGTGADVRQSILMDGCDIGSDAKIRRAIVEEGMHLPNGFEIGLEGDDRLFYVGPSGVIAIGEARRQVALAAA